jgi:hypothetical protein
LLQDKDGEKREQDEHGFRREEGTVKERTWEESRGRERGK